MKKEGWKEDIRKTREELQRLIRLIEDAHKNNKEEEKE